MNMILLFITCKVALKKITSSPTPNVNVMEESTDGVKRVSHRRLTICVIGSGGVGKSSLTLRYINGHFPEVNTLHYDSLLISFLNSFMTLQLVS